LARCDILLHARYREHPRESVATVVAEVRMGRYQFGRRLRFTAARSTA